MENLISILSSEPFENQFVIELALSVQENGGQIYSKVPNLSRMPRKAVLSSGFEAPSELLIAIGSAGIFTALYQTISSFLKRNQEREITAWFILPPIRQRNWLTN